MAAFKPVFPDCGIDFKVEVVLFSCFVDGVFRCITHQHDQRSILKQGIEQLTKPIEWELLLVEMLDARCRGGAELSGAHG